MPGLPCRIQEDLEIAECGMRIADCGLRIADCGLRIADCGLRIALWVRFLLSTVNC
jgi:hypothetical protein